MKLKNKLKMFEEFTSAEKNTETAIDSKGGVTTSSNVTSILDDVDNILNNLIELSDRVAENNTLEIEFLYEELYEAINATMIDEGILDFIKSPIKYAKIKKALKMYQKALVQQAINDVDYAKKKQAAKENPDSKAAETLKQANLAKNKALGDQIDALNDKMSELSKGDEGLSKLVSLGKSKSKLAASKTVIKATSGEEAKQLKLEIDTLEDRIARDEKSLKDYAAKQSTSDQDSAEDEEKVQRDAEAAAKSKKQLGYSNEGLDGSGRLSSMIKEKGESEEIEEVEESTKIYEGMSILQKFKALM